MNYFMGDGKKKVSVLIPCRNEVHYIERCIRNAYDFDAPKGGFEVIVIEGMSDDGTRDVLFRIKEQSYSNLIMIDNPLRIVPHAMNLGIKNAGGDFIVRIDVRCIHPKSYLIDLMELIEETKADNVGGVLSPIGGNTYTERSIALAYKSRIAMGGALRERDGFVGETDTVYGGCFKRERLIEVGLYDEEMVRNQDDELSFRIREKGGKIIQSSKIRIQYQPRKYFQPLFKQFLQYGYWKVAVIKKHPQQASIRHFLPSMLILGFIILGLYSPLHAYIFAGFIVYVGSYIIAVGLESLRIAFKRGVQFWPGVWVAICFIHLGFGLGFLLNIICRIFGVKIKWFETLSR